MGSDPRFNWAFFDCFDGGILLNHFNSGDTFALFADYVVKHRTKNARNPVKRSKIQATKEMTLQTTSEIFCSYPTNKQRPVDIVADSSIYYNKKSPV